MKRRNFIRSAAAGLSFSVLNPGCTTEPTDEEFERAAQAVSQEPFLAEIGIVAFNFAPRNWALCAGQLLPINQNQALFALLGTQYGGNGQTTFALPDLRGRAAMGFGSNREQGLRAGSETASITVAQLPSHSHDVMGTSDATHMSPLSGRVPASGSTHRWTDEPADGVLAAEVTGSFGAGESHANMQPYLVLNYVIALAGAFPSRN